MDSCALLFLPLVFLLVLCLPIFLSHPLIYLLCICLAISLCMDLAIIYVSINLSMAPYIYLPTNCILYIIYLTIHLPIYHLSNILSISIHPALTHSLTNISQVLCSQFLGFRSI